MFVMWWLSCRQLNISCEFVIWCRKISFGDAWNYCQIWPDLDSFYWSFMTPAPPGSNLKCLLKWVKTYEKNFIERVKFYQFFIIATVQIAVFCQICSLPAFSLRRILISVPFWNPGRSTRDSMRRSTQLTYLIMNYPSRIFPIRVMKGVRFISHVQWTL
jgi:hypothetical protein